jgi:hypothetical protein
VLMSKTIVKKSINLPDDLVKEIEKKIQNYPGLNFTLVVNQALEQWLRGPQEIKLWREKERDSFIEDNSKGFGPYGSQNRKTTGSI